MRMTALSGRLALALVLAALCLGARTAHAQAAPVPYLSAGWPLGFGGNLGQGSNAYGDFSGFDGSNISGGGASQTRFNFPNGWFVGSERSGIGLGGMQQGAAFGNFGGLYTEGARFGYSFKNASGLPVTFYGGLDTLKFNTGIGNPVSPFNPVSGTAGYSARAGIEIQPTSNLSLSLGVGYTQQSGRLDSDINSALLPGASPFGLGGRR
jgi:opacity protein-like surface antigen